MAKYQPGPEAPEQGQRIDGQAWDAAGPGATVRGWVYPTMGPDPWFVRVDGVARALDEEYDGFTQGQKDEWEQWANAYPVMARCGAEWEGEEVPTKRYLWTGLIDGEWYQLEGDGGVILAPYDCIYIGACNIWANAPDDAIDGGVVDILIDLWFDDDSTRDMAIVIERPLVQQSGPGVYINDFAIRYDFDEYEKAKALVAVRWWIYVDDPGGAGISGEFGGEAELILSPRTEDHALD